MSLNPPTKKRLWTQEEFKKCLKPSQKIRGQIAEHNKKQENLLDCKTVNCVKCGKKPPKDTQLLDIFNHSESTTLPTIACLICTKKHLPDRLTQLIDQEELEKQRRHRTAKEL